MIRRTPGLDAFERSYLARHVPLSEKLMHLESLFQEAQALGVFPLTNPLDGIEVDIKRSRILNGLRRHA